MRATGISARGVHGLATSRRPSGRGSRPHPAPDTGDHHGELRSLSRSFTLTAEISREWFPEPARADDTYLRRGEPITSWLKRSTIPGAKECRHFLNENLSSLPSGHQRVLYQALHNRWHSAFFEVIVARTLQVLSAEIEIEPGSETGTRMDFLARFSDHTVSVEAVAPVFNADVGETAARRAPLLESSSRWPLPDGGSWWSSCRTWDRVTPGVSSRVRSSSCSKRSRRNLGRSQRT